MDNLHVALDARTEPISCRHRSESESSEAFRHALARTARSQRAAQDVIEAVAARQPPGDCGRSDKKSVLHIAFLFAVAVATSSDRSQLSCSHE